MEKGFIIALVFAIIVGVFALANSEIVMIDFLFTEVAVSQAIVIMISTFLGAIIVFTFSYYKIFKLKQEIKNLKKQIDQIKSENQLMKSLDKTEEIEEEITDKI